MKATITSARNILKVGTALSLVASASGAWAQAAPEAVPAPADQTATAPAPAPASAAASADSGEIVVTATRREERLSKVPVSVVAFNADTLKDRAITS